MKIKLIVLFFLTMACSSKNESHRINYDKARANLVRCTDEFCHGEYKGKEFVKGSDVAHQFSNTMSTAVGKKLKTLYDLKKYSKVDFGHIEMSTKGMGTGVVVYSLKIPFVRVQTKCESFTSFDHVGGWNHTPELERRKSQLQKALLVGDSLHISELKRTKEGLQEYWIQWRNKDKQADCQLKSN